MKKAVEFVKELEAMNPENTVWGILAYKRDTALVQKSVSSILAELSDFRDGCSTQTSQFAMKEDRLLTQLKSIQQGRDGDLAMLELEIRDASTKRRDLQRQEMAANTRLQGVLKQGREMSNQPTNEARLDQVFFFVLAVFSLMAIRLEICLIKK